MPLAPLFEARLKMEFSNDDGPWKQFILDHLDYIAVNSRKYELSDALMHRYQFDLMRFLKDHMNRHVDMAWIVLLLNNLRNDFDFKDVNYLIVPEDSLITKLYASFRTISQENR